MSRGRHSSSAQYLSTRAGMPSGPVALAGFRRLSSLRTVSGRKRTSDRLAFVRRLTLGSSLLLRLGGKSFWPRMHLEAKYLPKHSALSELDKCSVPDWSVTVGIVAFLRISGVVEIILHCKI